ncbi:hypothetical protein ACIQU6_14185 [Streptomyces sp. NPDC090442]|uniref:hypothetical protein n=1 Tax=Streptomyces sp. NPDC090442 TaxID=3365962 RepID=UPI0037F15684
MTARRPLLTATAAGSVLCALWFVPSANAIVEVDGAPHSGPPAESAAARAGRANVSDAAGPQGHSGKASAEKNSGAQSANSGSTTTRSGGGPHHYLADTGSPDTTPYAVGGAAFLALGAALVGYSVRRTRDGAA